MLMFTCIVVFVVLYAVLLCEYVDVRRDARIWQSRAETNTRLLEERDRLLEGRDRLLDGRLEELCKVENRRWHLGAAEECEGPLGTLWANFYAERDELVSGRKERLLVGVIRLVPSRNLPSRMEKACKQAARVVGALNEGVNAA